MLDLSTQASPLKRARLIGALAANDGRQDYLRSACEQRDGDIWVRPFAAQDSSMLKLFAEADALIVREPHAPSLADGAPVDILPLE
jgi:molybdopterin molybdotransferase